MSVGSEQIVAGPGVVSNALTGCVSAIIVSYNTREMTLRCLQTLFEKTSDILRDGWVIDNASADGSVAAIRKAFPQVRMVANDQNVGFGAANNQAMAGTQAEYMLLLNSDAFVEAGAIESLVNYLETHPKIAAVGPRLLNTDGSLQVSCYPFPSPWRAWSENTGICKLLPSATAVGDFHRWDHASEIRPPWVIGACLLVRRAVFAQIGGFDERFFLYSEETDWQFRMRQAGWEIGFTPAATVIHAAAGSGSADRPRTNQLFFESQDKYQIKHYGWFGFALFRGAMIFGCGLRTVLWSAAFLASPRLRARARVKASFNRWLFLRELFTWRLHTRPIVVR